VLALIHHCLDVSQTVQSHLVNYSKFLCMSRRREGEKKRERERERGDKYMYVHK
jgi:hypothetical protein